MEIKTYLDTLNPYEKSKLEKTAPGKAGAAERAAQTRTADTVSLSGDGRLVALAKQEAQAAPETRSEKVAGLKASVKAGTYEPDGRAIAEKLVQDELDMRGE